MKLNKTQRLFVAIGHIDARILSESMRSFTPPTQKEKFSIVKQELKQLRARRKKLIRKALRAYELEIADAFTAGYEMCKRDNNISNEYMLIDGDIIF
jgi:hypothetical protein